MGLTSCSVAKISSNENLLLRLCVTSLEFRRCRRNYATLFKVIDAAATRPLFEEIWYCRQGGEVLLRQLGRK
jgi:hypothetical protein